MKIKEQARKLAVGCSKHYFEVVDKTDKVSSKHRFEVADTLRLQIELTKSVDKTDEVSSKHGFEVVDETDEVSHIYTQGDGLKSFRRVLAVNLVQSSQIILISRVLFSISPRS
ncbi:hypothetical protein [Streptococcus pneumoniae]|uniref:hypothetical protein n=1 Tax=Streptococcus pneumoniae TaxID=1313 RepID=UPI0005E45764|nr:hypothetical protein [Streptococcus pneumoniae]CNA45464.1 chlorohydrolase [Streptococcus pneumoniae]